jgi:metal-responsive CopG/Arc/MetJ family transcriptional regulator
VNISGYMTKTEAETELIEGRERTSVRLPEDLLNEFRHLAIDRKTTVTELLIAAMKMYLKASKK